MNFRLVILAIASIALVGCATTKGTVTPVNQLQNQVTDLEQRMEEQEKEVVDLKYEVKEIAGKIDGQMTVEVETSAPVAEVKVDAVNADIIKVGVSVSEVQKALKGAGLYEGKIDGKLGSKSKAAIVEFQKQHGLKADGVIGQKTWAEMKTYITAE